MIIRTHKKFELWTKVGDSFVKANYLVTDMNSQIVGAYITKRDQKHNKGLSMMKFLLMILPLLVISSGCGTVEQTVSTSISPYDSREIDKINVSLRYTYTFPK